MPVKKVQKNSAANRFIPLKKSANIETINGKKGKYFTILKVKFLNYFNFADLLNYKLHLFPNFLTSMKNLYKLAFLCFIVLTLKACRSDDDQNSDDDLIIQNKSTNEYGSEVVTEWYALIKTLTTETPGFTPPVAARAFGYTGIALYESVQFGIPNRNSLSGKLNEFSPSVNYDANKEYNWELVANSTLAEMVKYYYTNTSVARFNSILELEKKYNEAIRKEVSEDVYNRSVLLSKNTVDAILAYSITDGGYNGSLNNFPSSYTPPQGEQFWVPTPPDFLSALQPYWGANRPFLTQNIQNTQPALPPVFSKDTASVFYKRAMNVYETVNNITAPQVAIAEFWSDDPLTTATPPGHSIAILNQLIKENNSNLSVAAEAFAKLGIGVSDAFISCWKVKYETNYLRPITYINRYIDSSWVSILPTPPFPEFTSGHSVQSGALAEIMTDLFGENYQFIDSTHVNRTDINGTPRTFSSFYELAEEAAISRLYGGIHYTEAIDLGLEQGYQIGKNVNALKLEN